MGRVSVGGVVVVVVGGGGVGGAAEGMVWSVGLVGCGTDWGGELWELVVGVKAYGCSARILR